MDQKLKIVTVFMTLAAFMLLAIVVVKSGKVGDLDKQIITLTSEVDDLKVARQLAEEEVNILRSQSEREREQWAKEKKNLEEAMSGLRDQLKKARTNR